MYEKNLRQQHIMFVHFEFIFVSFFFLRFYIQIDLIAHSQWNPFCWDVHYQHFAQMLFRMSSTFESIWSNRWVIECHSNRMYGEKKWIQNIRSRIHTSYQFLHWMEIRWDFKRWNSLLEQSTYELNSTTSLNRSQVWHMNICFSEICGEKILKEPISIDSSS